MEVAKENLHGSPQALDFLEQVEPVPTFIAFPMPIRILVVGLIALVVAQIINWAIYSLAYNRRRIGAWSSPPPGAPPRTILDWLPIIGWWRLRRETKYHDSGYWIRPFLIEIVFPLAMLWLYRFETSGGTLPVPRLAAALTGQIHFQFVAHFLLIALMTVATFIDFDEQTIPDWITVTGTLIGLLGSATFGAWFSFWPIPFGNRVELEEIHAFTPNSVSDWVASPWGYALAMAIATIWCFALLDRRWITRRGWKKAGVYFFAGMFRNYWWVIVTTIWLITLSGITLAWFTSIERWHYLVSALLGMACAGGITWAVRLIATRALGVEALGFGDVTLMAMIGVYVGWQASLLIFFVSPVMAVFIFVGIWLFTKRNAGAYGPYLCAGAAVVVIGWEYFARNWALPIFELPAKIIFTILAVALVLLGLSLWIILLVKGNVRGLRAQQDSGS